MMYFYIKMQYKQHFNISDKKSMLRLSSVPLTYLCSLTAKPSEDVQLATRLKKGSCTGSEDMDKITSLVTDLDSENSKQFFNNSVVQRKLLKGFLDGTIEDERIRSALENCTPSLKETDQINIVTRKTKKINDLSPEKARNLAFVWRFLQNIPANLQESITKLKPVTPLVDEEISDQISDQIIPDASGIAESMSELKQTLFTFETIASNIAGTAKTVAAILDIGNDFCNQENNVSNKQLIEFIPYNTCSHTEQQKFEGILASPEKSKSFFNDHAVQITILEKWLNDGAIDQRILDALHECTPDLSSAEQRKIEEQLFKLLDNTTISSYKKVTLLQFLTDSLSHERQQSLASAIQNGKFGTDPAVLQALIKKLEIFTDPTALGIIVEAIRDGIFGLDPDVLQALVAKLDILADSKVPKSIAMAVRNGRFGTNPAVLEELVKKLDLFSDKGDQDYIAEAIKNGKFGSDSTVLQLLIEKLKIFSITRGQRNITYAVEQGKFGTDPAVLQALIGQLKIFTDSDAQQNIANAIRKGRFGTDQAVLQAILAQNLSPSINSAAQENINAIIERKRLNLDPLNLDPLDMLNQLAEKPGSANDLNQQRKIAEAVFNGELGIDPTTLQSVVKKLDKLTDSTAQEWIAKAIQDGRFGTDPVVLLALIEKLGTFNDPFNSLFILSAIKNGRFGTNRVVLLALIEKLGTLTSLMAQQHIAQSIENGAFGTDPAVLQALTKKLVTLTSPTAQAFIADAILERKFGNQCGTDSVVFKAAMTGIPIYCKAIIRLMPSLPLTPEEKLFILRQMKFSLGLPNEVGEIPADQLPYLFGAKAYADEEVIELITNVLQTEAFSNVVTVLNPNAIDEAIDSDTQYALQIDAPNQRVILYPLTQGQADFTGWITSDSSVFYKQCIGQVKIFDFSELRDGYPKIIYGKDLSPTHALFTTLPGYLKRAASDNNFNSAEFKHNATIKFVIETLLKPLGQAEPELVHQMQAIMQSSIAAGGDYVKIASTDNEDADIKNHINKLCKSVSTNVDFTAIVKTFFNQLDVDDKARFAVLLGTMAKKGVLGYHHGNNNQANDLLYSLAKEYFDQLRGAVGIVFPENFHAHLAKGVCIEQLTNSFIIANLANENNRKDFNDVFVKIA